MKRRWATLLATALAMNVFVLPGAALASTTEVIADTGGMLVALGSGLNINVTLDEIGHIDVVTVGNGVAFTEDRAGDHKIRFSNDEDSTRVDVKAKNSKLSASVKASDLASIVGTHTWSANLFGAGDTDVTFVVGDDGGDPVIVDGSVLVTPAAGELFDIGDIKTEDDDDEVGSSVKVIFTFDGYQMVLKISVERDLEEDDDDEADERSYKLKIELKGKDLQKLQGLVSPEGDYFWEGLLCDLTPVRVDYSVDRSGTVIAIDVNVDGYELKEKDHGFEVKFDDSKAKVSVSVKQKDDGTWELKVKSKTTEKCDDHDDDVKKKNSDDDHDEDDDD